MYRRLTLIRLQRTAMDIKNLQENELHSAIRRSTKIVFKERYSPTTDQAIAIANNIVNVELRNCCTDSSWK